MQNVSRGHDTALSVAPLAAGPRGPGSIRHLVPSHRSTSAAPAFPLEVNVPTAIHARDETQRTSFKALSIALDGLGDGSIDQT
jgi:hypothetical protein